MLKPSYNKIKEPQPKKKETKPSLNDKQKWFVTVGVGCISTLMMAITFENFSIDVFEVALSSNANWTGCVLFGILCSSITGFFLFKDK